MRRVAAALLCAAGLAVFVVSCENSQLPTPPNSGPSALISDGAHSGNSHFFFLPPIVPSPSFSGTFNPGAKPVVEICELAGDPADPNVVCGDGSDTDGDAMFRRFEASDVEMRLADELYVVEWQTVEDGLNTEAIYRITVALENVGGFSSVVLGVADVDVEATQEDLKSVDLQNYVALLIDRTLPIKFRIEYGFFCEAIGGGPDCGEGIFDQNGGTATNTDATAGISASALPLEEGEEMFIAVETIACPVDGDGRINLMNVDFPQRGRCMKITPSQQLTQPVNPLLTVGVCLVAEPAIVNSESFHVLRAKNPFDPNFDDVYVGPHRNASSPPPVGAGFLTGCEGTGGSGGSASTNKFLNFAQRGWKAIKRAVNPLQAVPVYADHVGKGGGFPETSHFDWGYVVQMGKVPGVDGLVVAGAATLNPEVLVTNIEDQPVAETDITFSGDGTINGGTDPVTVASGSNGMSSVQWDVGPTPGNYQLTVNSFGVGVHPDDGGSGPQFPPANNQRLLEMGTMTFEVTVCAPGSGFGVPQAIDGVITDQEYECAKKYPFFANLSGGGVDSDLFYMNDKDYLYLAVRIPRDESDKDNTVQFNFHKAPSPGADITGAASAGDNVVVLDATNSPTSIIDGYLTADCVNKKQSACFGLDTTAGGDTDGMAWFSNDGTYNMYEFQIPLNVLAGADLGLDLDLAPGDEVGFFMSIQLGKGSQGNTELLDFREYLIHQVQ